VTLSRTELIAEQGIDTVVDVGANEGLFARQLRDEGFSGRIISFEPLSKAFALLESASANDPDWECRQLALGSATGRKTLNVAQNLASSSFLPMESGLPEAEPRLAYIGTEECSVSTLDALARDLFQPDERLYVKLDVQGFELEVLQGAEATLDRVLALDVELSLSPVYEGAPLIDEVVGHLADRGYDLVLTESAYVHPRTGETLQENGLFMRRSA
jgi:FkbM family methyltransferase